LADIKAAREKPACILEGDMVGGTEEDTGEAGMAGKGEVSKEGTEVEGLAASKAENREEEEISEEREGSEQEDAAGKEGPAAVAEAGMEGEGGRSEAPGREAGTVAAGKEALVVLAGYRAAPEE